MVKQVLDAFLLLDGLLFLGKVDHLDATRSVNLECCDCDENDPAWCHLPTDRLRQRVARHVVAIESVRTLSCKPCWNQQKRRADQQLKSEVSRQAQKRRHAHEDDGVVELLRVDILEARPFFSDEFEQEEGHQGTYQNGA